MAEDRKTWEDILQEKEIDKKATGELRKPDLVKLTVKLGEQRITQKDEHLRVLDDITQQLMKEQTLALGLRDELDQEQKQITGLDDELIQKQTLINKLNDELKQEQTKVTGMSDKLKHEHTLNIDLKNELKQEQTQIQDHTKENNVLDKMVKQMKVERSALIIEIDLKDTLIAEKDKAKKALLDALAENGDDCENDNQLGKPRFLLVYQAGVSKVPNNLNKEKIDWDITEVKSISEFSKTIRLEEYKEIYPGYDKIILLLGLDDIKEGYAPKPIFNLLKQIVTELKEHTLVSVVQIPQITINNLLYKTEIFNHRITNMKVEGAENILFTREIELTPSVDMMSNDGITLSEEGAKLYADMISNIAIPDPKAKPTKSEGAMYPSSSQNLKIKEFVQLEASKVGHVIGKGGNIISKLTRENEVNISFGRFVEKKKDKEGKEKEGKSTEGYLCEGKLTNIQNAKKRVREVVVYSEEQERKKQR